MNADSDTSRRCNLHEEEPSIARCTECKREICHRCHVSDLRGFAICKACRGDDPSPLPPWEIQTSQSAPEALAMTLWGALSSPSRFWEPTRHNPSWLPAFVFGVILIVCGDMLFTCWEFLLDERLEKVLRESMVDSSAAEMPSGVLRAMSILRVLVLAPIIFIARTYMLKLAIKLAGVEADWATCARIFGYGCASYIWLLIPPIQGVPVGHMLMLVWMFNIQIAGVRHFYRTLGPVQSLLVVMLPVMLATGIGCV